MCRAGKEIKLGKPKGILQSLMYYKEKVFSFIKSLKCHYMKLFLHIIIVKYNDLTNKKQQLDSFKPLPPELIRNLNNWFKWSLLIIVILLKAIL